MLRSKKTHNRKLMTTCNRDPTFSPPKCARYSRLALRPLVAPPHSTTPTTPTTPTTSTTPTTPAPATTTYAHARVSHQAELTMAAMDEDGQEELDSSETEAVPKRTSSAPVPVPVPVPVPSLRPNTPTPALALALRPRLSHADARLRPHSHPRTLTPHAHAPSSPPPGGRPVPIDDERYPGRFCSQLRMRAKSRPKSLHRPSSHGPLGVGDRSYRLVPTPSRLSPYACTHPTTAYLTSNHATTTTHHSQPVLACLTRGIQLRPTYATHARRRRHPST